jgi:hypothetical protein
VDLNMRLRSYRFKYQVRVCVALAYCTLAASIANKLCIAVRSQASPASHVAMRQYFRVCLVCVHQTRRFSTGTLVWESQPLESPHLTADRSPSVCEALPLVAK